MELIIITQALFCMVCLGFAIGYYRQGLEKDVVYKGLLQEYFGFITKSNQRQTELEDKFWASLLAARTSKGDDMDNALAGAALNTMRNQSHVERMNMDTLNETQVKTPDAEEAVFESKMGDD